MKISNPFIRSHLSSHLKFCFTAVIALALSQSVFAGSNPPRIAFLDYSGGDKRSDFVLFNQLNGNRVWKIMRNADTPPDVVTTFQYGLASDQVTPGNFLISTGGKTEVSVFRNGTFYDAPFLDYVSPPPTTILTGWGQAGDYANYFGDYDGDGYDNHTVLRYQSSTGLFYWYIKGNNGQQYVYLFGQNNPETYEFAFRGADYNGDGRDEVVFVYVYIATGQVVWYFGDPINQTLVGVHAFGNYRTDKLLNPADYTGDKKADLMVWQSKAEYYTGMGNWKLFDRVTGTTYSVIDRGWPDHDVPLQGDYDGDGISDIAWYRPSTSTFGWSPSSMRWYPSGDTHYLYGSILTRAFGTPGDVPAAGLWAY